MSHLKKVYGERYVFYRHEYIRHALSIRSAVFIAVACTLSLVLLFYAGAIGAASGEAYSLLMICTAATYTAVLIAVIAIVASNLPRYERLKAIRDSTTELVSALKRCSSQAEPGADAYLFFSNADFGIVEAERRSLDGDSWTVKLYRPDNHSGLNRNLVFHGAVMLHRIDRVGELASGEAFPYSDGLVSLVSSATDLILQSDHYRRAAIKVDNDAVMRTP